MYGCENWAIKKAEHQELILLNCGVGKDSWESLNQSWIFIGRTGAEAEIPILWPSDSKNWLIEKNPDAGKDWKQEEKGPTEDEMVGWHHQLNGHKFEQALGVGDGQGSLAYCSPWGCKDSDRTEWLNWTGGSGVKNLPTNAGVQSLVQEDPTNCRATQPCWPQLLSLRSRAQEPQLLSPHAAAPEAQCPWACALQQGEPLQ